MSTKFSNIPIAFPIISLIESDAIRFDDPKSYFVCHKSYIPQLNKLKEEIIDANGILYKRKEVYFIKSINVFLASAFASLNLVFVMSKKTLRKSKL